LNAKALGILILCFIALFASFAYSFFEPIYTQITVFPLTIMTILFFAFGLIFFGYLAFLPHIYLGLTMGAEKNALIFVYFLPIALATYVGVKIGTSIEEDFKLNEYLSSRKNKSLIQLLIFAILLSVFIEVALPIILNMQIWPEDLLGLKIEGRNVENIFDILKR
jgi:hypothetical protein